MGEVRRGLGIVKIGEVRRGQRDENEGGHEGPERCIKDDDELVILVYSRRGVSIAKHPLGGSRSTPSGEKPAFFYGRVIRFLRIDVCNKGPDSLKSLWLFDNARSLHI